MSLESLPPSLRALVRQRHGLGAFGVHGRWRATTGSTNDDAAAWAQAGAPEGAWVAAGEQTAGRGRRGRRWVSPPGSGLYFSIVFRPAKAVPVSNDPATTLLTLMAGVATAEGIAAASGVRVTLKWPNDIMAEQSWRKAGGILAEAATSGGAIPSIVVGIGVNLLPGAYPPEVAARAVSLSELAGGVGSGAGGEGEAATVTVDREVTLVEILAAMSAWRARLLNGETGALLDAWRRCSPSSTGRRVSWTTAEGGMAGVTAGIDAAGALLVETPSGRRRVVAGEIVWT